MRDLGGIRYRPSRRLELLISLFTILSYSFIAKVVSCLSSSLFILFRKDLEKVNRSTRLERAPPRLLIVVVISALSVTFSAKTVKV